MITAMRTDVRAVFDRDPAARSTLLTATPSTLFRRCPTWNSLWVFGWECSTITFSAMGAPWP